MLIKTLLNKCYPVKGFIYGKVILKETRITVKVKERKGSQGICSQCKKAASTYDHLQERCFRFVPLWGYIVMLAYRPRRVSCPQHGVTVEHIPWAQGKSPICEPFRIFLAHWAKHLSWLEVARQFRVSWKNVFESVEHVVEYGLKHRNLDNVSALGIDEIQYLKHHKYLTLVFQIDSVCKRLLFVGQNRSAKTLLRFFHFFGKERSGQLKAICSDLWKPYLKVVKRKAPKAIHILDRFHVMKYLNDAVDQTRRAETAQLKEDGYEPILEKSRWCLLKNKRNQKTSQLAKLRELVQYNLKTVRCYLLKEAFQHFWTYKTRWGAERFLRTWTTRAMRSRLPEMKKVAKRLRKHQELLLNYFSVKERLSNGVVEGFNLKAKLTMRRSFGFRTLKSIEIALYHTLGKLPEPPITHRFY
ncbi:MAG: ISL3 family transposase [Planctomycetes bacterium]|nr:ISL3 family transposase [Planctomycetota bacterium]NOG83079.1 ISL3 family transposase [Planctomycetota bacterium]NOG83683.1 ISL3 family transposase [Planctomycetota bacterium]NOG84398.1 ISL3 family transposase [Planctomycetota bacterium]NOG85235.1 ISL3 family transposase [Planctomycetota bacterium]